MTAIEQEAIRTNRQFIEKQRRSFASGNTLKDLLGISVQHPIISLIFILAFSILGNSIFALMQQLLPSNTVNIPDTAYYLYFVIGSLVLMIIIIIGFKIKSIFLYKNVELHQKKVLVVIASVSKDYTKTAAYNFISAMLYSKNNSAKRNMLEKIYILSSEEKTVQANAKKLKKYCSDQNREAEIFQIDIQGNDKNVESIQKQINITVKEKILSRYKSSEIIADFTGGTKEISVALYLCCLDNFILPAYLNVPKKGPSGEVIQNSI